MNDKDLIEFFIYLRDYCYNRDFQIEPKIVVEDFRNHQCKTILMNNSKKELYHDYEAEIKKINDL